MTDIAKKERDEQKRCLIDARIHLLRSDMRSLIEFYVGEKTLENPTLPRTYLDDQRFLSKLRHLREHIENLQQERSKIGKK